MFRELYFASILLIGPFISPTGAAEKRLCQDHRTAVIVPQLGLCLYNPLHFRLDFKLAKDHCEGAGASLLAVRGPEDPNLQLINAALKTKKRLSGNRYWIAAGNLPHTTPPPTPRYHKTTRRPISTTRKPTWTMPKTTRPPPTTRTTTPTTTTRPPLDRAPSTGKYRTCREIRTEFGITSDGVYTLFLWDAPNQRHIQIKAVCEMSTGGYTLIHQRVDGTVPFDKPWAAYKAGFGDVTVNGSHWLGNDNIHRLGNCGAHKLRVDLQDCNNNRAYEEFSTFKVAAESDLYRLTLAGASGTAGDGGMLVRDFASGHIGIANKMAFSTRDRDNDKHPISCAQRWGGGGWWYIYCYQTMLNAVYHNGCPDSGRGSIGNHWYGWPGKGWTSELYRASMKVM